METGAKKLTQLYTKLVAEVSSGSTPAPGAEWAMAPFPSSLLSTLRQLVSFLRTLPLPSTHPSHPAAPAIFETLKDAQRGYADMRGVWTQKCLEGQGKRLVGRADTIDTIVAGKEFGKWVDLVLTVSEVCSLLANYSNSPEPQSRMNISCSCSSRRCRALHSSHPLSEYLWPRFLLFLAPR